MAGVTGGAFGLVAWLGWFWWRDAGWYFHPQPDYRLDAAQKALRRSDRDRAEQAALVLEADGHHDQAALLQGAIDFERAIHADESAAAPLFTKVLDELNTIRDQGAVRVQAAAIIGRCLMSLKRPIEAEHSFRFVLREEPDNVESHRGLAVIYFDQGALGSALPHLEKVAELDPQDGRPHRLMGLIYKDWDQYDLAVKCYQRGLERQLPGRNPEQSQAAIYREMAECLLNLKQYAQALEVLDRVEPLADDAPRVVTMRAECLCG